MGLYFAVYWTGEFIVNLEAPNPEKTRVSIGTRLLSHIKRARRTNIATCGLAEETENKKKMWEKKVTQPLNLTTTWRRHFATDLHQIW